MLNQVRPNAITLIEMVALLITITQWDFLDDKVQPGQVGGHEGIGNIVKLGPYCEQTNLSIGDRVGIKWTAYACGTCAPCLAGADGICEKQKVSGFSCPGTFQEYVISWAHYVTRIPSGLPSHIAAPLLCGGVTVYAALKKSRASPGDWVVIAGGGGGLGHLAVQLASRGMGYRVIGLDVSTKEELVKSCGAEIFLDILSFPQDDGGDTLSAEIKKHTGGKGASAVVVCSGSNAAYAQGLKLLKFNGTLVCVGVPRGLPVAVAHAYPHYMVAQQLALVGSTVGNRKDAIEVLDMASRGLVTTHVQTAAMDHLPHFFGQMEDGTLNGRGVITMS